jgi:gamma-glutamyltranspeptidase/glutathione hydrolase
MVNPHSGATSDRERATPCLTGDLGAVSTAHPLGTAAGQVLLANGGTAADAAVAAQAVLCVVLPQSCGLGGDCLAVIADGAGSTEAVVGAGATSASGVLPTILDDGSSATVPGIVDAWATLIERHGRRPLAEVLAPAVRLAEHGVVMDEVLTRATRSQRHRIEQGGGAEWALLHADPGSHIVQPELAEVLRAIGREGAGWFYEGPIAEAIGRAAQSYGGVLTSEDLAAHRTLLRPPIELLRAGQRIVVAPPPSQGVLLAVVLSWLDQLASETPEDEHVGVELVQAAFALRDRVAEGEALLGEDRPAIPDRASRRAGPRSYLHTAGVSVADRNGLVVSSLISLFDDFGSGTFVPEGGFVLNNRASGFTRAPNDPAPGKRPVHTLAPILMCGEDASIALATPGADGQVQTLFQVLEASHGQPGNAPAAIAAPRWRSEEGHLLIERSHQGAGRLAALGHDVTLLDDGDEVFGSVVCAGVKAGVPVAAADWRRQSWAGVA